MTDNFPPEEEDLCTDCTIEDCTLCPYPSSAGGETLIYSDADFIVDPKGVAYIPYEPGIPESTSEPQNHLSSPVVNNPPQPLLPPPTDPPKYSSHLTQNNISIPRKRGRPKKEVDPSITKRRPGGQPGNLNALRHGLYVQGNAIYNSTPMERAKLYDITGMITHLKEYFDTTFENGKKLKKTFEINDTMRVLSSATIAVSRAIHTQQGTTIAWLPDSLREIGRNTPLKKIEDFYQNKIQYLDPSPMEEIDEASESASETRKEE